MLTCPMCKKTLAESTSHCPRCRTDMSILVDYVSQLQDGLARAEECTRSGELAEAVWAYLEVLEVDPDNALARKQVDRVVAAVRQFDRAAVGRRWLDQVRVRARLRRWTASWKDLAAASSWWNALATFFLLILAGFLGYLWGRYAAVDQHDIKTGIEVLAK